MSKYECYERSRHRKLSPVAGTQVIKVVRQGSKLMDLIDCPAVIVKAQTMNFRSSKVYYVTLESDSKEFSGQIVAVMFSKPSTEERTEYAELLPLEVDRSYAESGKIVLTPLLNSDPCRRLFRNGSSFILKSLESGRYVDRLEHPWSRWDLRSRVSRIMLKDLVYQDMNKMPLDMIIGLSPSVSHELSSSNSRSRSTSKDDKEENLSDYYTSLRLLGVATKGGSSFADWFKVVPPNVRVDKDFECSNGTKLRKDNFESVKMFENYLGICAV